MAARYERPPKRYVLKFEDHPGLEVVMKGLPVGEFLELAQMAGRLQGRNLLALSGEELAGAIEATDGLFAKFAAALVSWNLDENGQPVPATVDGVRSQDLDFILELLLAWMDAVVAVDTPLPQPANGQGTSLEASMPMETLSASPGS